MFDLMALIKFYYSHLFCGHHALCRVNMRLGEHEARMGLSMRLGEHEAR